MVVAGALAAGFVSGLSGFGTGLTALGLWLHVINPVIAAALVVICSIVAQLQSLYTLRRELNWHRLWPFLVGGVMGIPLGVAALNSIDINALKLALGMFLAVYCGLMLWIKHAPQISAGARVGDGVIGFGGGVLGGLSGLSGPLPIIWCGLKGWSADAQRAVYQPFNLAVLSLTLGAYAVNGMLTKPVWTFALACIPATLTGVYFGVRTYGHVDEAQFKTIVLGLLLLSGVTLVVTNLP